MVNQLGKEAQGKEIGSGRQSLTLNPFYAESLFFPFRVKQSYTKEALL
jgi:hypothetical protein